MERMPRETRSYELTRVMANWLNHKPTRLSMALNLKTLAHRDNYQTLKNLALVMKVDFGQAKCYTEEVVQFAVELDREAIDGEKKDSPTDYVAPPRGGKSVQLWKNVGKAYGEPHWENPALFLDPFSQETFFLTYWMVHGSTERCNRHSGLAGAMVYVLMYKENIWGLERDLICKLLDVALLRLPTVLVKHVDYRTPAEMRASLEPGVEMEIYTEAWLAKFREIQYRLFPVGRCSGAEIKHFQEELCN